jgi:hypothetical protein
VASSDDREHQAQLKESSNQNMTLFRASEDRHEIAMDCKQKLSSLASSSLPLPGAKTVVPNVQSDAVNTVRAQNLILSTDLPKAKRELESGCKDRTRRSKS